MSCPEFGQCVLPGHLLDELLGWLWPSTINQLRLLGHDFHDYISEYWHRYRLARQWTDPLRGQMTDEEICFYHFSQTRVCFGSVRFISPVLALARSIALDDPNLITHAMMATPYAFRSNPFEILRFLAFNREADLFVQLVRCRRWHRLDVILDQIQTHYYIMDVMRVIPTDLYPGVLLKLHDYGDPLTKCLIGENDRERVSLALAEAKVELGRIQLEVSRRCELINAVTLALFRACEYKDPTLTHYLLANFDYRTEVVQKLSEYAAYLGHHCILTIHVRSQVEWRVRGGHPVEEYSDELLYGTAAKGDVVGFQLALEKKIQPMNLSETLSQDQMIALNRNLDRALTRAIVGKHSAILRAILRRLGRYRLRFCRSLHRAIMTGSSEIAHLLIVYLRLRLHREPNSRALRVDLRRALVNIVCWFKFSLLRIILKGGYPGSADDLKEALRLSRRDNMGASKDIVSLLQNALEHSLGTSH